MDNPPDAELPRYRSHKEVWALKIKSIELDADKALSENRAKAFEEGCTRTEGR